MPLERRMKGKWILLRRSPPRINPRPSELRRAFETSTDPDAAEPFKRRPPQNQPLRGEGGGGGLYSAKVGVSVDSPLQHRVETHRPGTFACISIGGKIEEKMQH